MFRILCVLLASTALVACTHQPSPPTVWIRPDGQRGPSNPVLDQQFIAERPICLGNEQAQAPDVAAKRCIPEEDYSEGGVIKQFINAYTDLQNAGGSIKLDGECFSACTLFTGLVDSDHVCITDRAVLGFHSAHTPDGAYAPYGTAVMWSLYPERIRNWLATHGWSDGEHPSVIRMNHHELQKFYRACA